MLHEEAMRVNRMCRELRKKDVLQDVLRLAHDRSLNKYASIDEEDDFQVSVCLNLVQKSLRTKRNVRSQNL